MTIFQGRRFMMTPPSASPVHRALDGQGGGEWKGVGEPWAAWPPHAHWPQYFLPYNFSPIAQSRFSISSCLCSKSLQSCPTHCDPMDYSTPGSSVQGTLQTRVLERAAMPSSRGSSQPRDWTLISCVSYIDRQVLYLLRSNLFTQKPVKHPPWVNAVPGEGLGGNSSGVTQHVLAHLELVEPEQAWHVHSLHLLLQTTQALGAAGARAHMNGN